MSPLDGWALSVHGEAERPFALDWEELMALEQVDVTCDIHCVTRWSKFDTRWRGVRVRTLLERARPRPGATHVMVHSHGGYTTNVPLDALLDDDVLVAHSFDGAPLEPDHGGPARLLVPSRYFWKSAKFVRRWSSWRAIARGSGRTTATTTTATPGARSATASTSTPRAACGAPRATGRAAACCCSPAPPGSSAPRCCRA